MTSSPSSLQESRDRPLTPAKMSRFFSIGAAILLFGFMLWGFHHFYFHGQAYPGRPLTPPIRPLIITHAITMTAWMILFLVQPLLILSGKRALHATLGAVGAVLAATIVTVGLGLAIAATRLNPPEVLIWGLSPAQFMAVPFFSILIFGILVGVGIWKRKQLQVHRSMMLLATLAVISAAISRIDAISNLYHGTFWESLFGPFFGSLVIAFLILIVQLGVTRSLNRVYALGCVGLGVASVLILQIAKTSAWAGFSSFLLH
jgi:hypothetical protein